MTSQAITSAQRAEAARAPQPRRLARSRALPWLVALIAFGLPLCVVFVLAVPVGEVADENAHLMRATALLEGEIIGHRETLSYSDGIDRPSAGVTIRSAWERPKPTRPVRDDLIPVVVDGNGSAAGAEAGPFVPLYTIATYFPGFYVPGSLGLALGRALGLSDAGAITAGRLANVAAYLLIGLAALAVAARGRALLFCVLMLPMTLSLAASYNHDSLIIATAALAAALLTRSSGRAFGLAAVLIGLIVLAKPPYAPLAAMLLLPLPERAQFGRFLARRLPVVILVVLPSALWFLYASAFVATPVPRFAYEAGPLWQGERPALFHGTDTRAQLGVLLTSPGQFLSLPAVALFGLKHMVTLWKGMIGIFGWLDRPLPAAVYQLWLAGLIATFAALAATRRLRPTWDLAVVAGAGLLCLWLVVLSQYLTWTNVGEARIDGPQGRYILPILPMVILGFAVGASAPAGWRRALTLLPIPIAAVSLVGVSIAVTRMY